MFNCAACCKIFFFPFFIIIFLFSLRNYVQFRKYLIFFPLAFIFLFIFRVRKWLHLASLNGLTFIYIYIYIYLWCRGLLASKMHETAKAIVTNLIYLIEEYGYVLNGARAYYTNRR